MKIGAMVKAGLVLPLVLFVFACASAPPAEPTPEPTPTPAPVEPVPVPVEPAKQAEPTEAKAAAEKARAEAALYGAETVLPDQWKTAADSFALGEKNWGTDNAASKTAFEAAAAGFSGLASKAKPLFEEALAKEKARAETERKQAFDLESSSMLADEWKAAEAVYLRARQEDQAKTYPQALASFTEAADAYRAVAEKVLPRFVEARRADIIKARADAVAAGADRLSADRLAVADADADRSVRLYEEADYYGAYDAWSAARSRYVILSIGSKAYVVKTSIDDRGFAAYDPGNYAKASEKLEAALATYDDGELEDARNASEESLLRFNLALAKGRELYAVDRGNAAALQREAALSLKADVAVKNDFEAAAKTKADAEAAFKAEKYEEAAALYADSENRFLSARELAAEKRKRALEAMEAAARRQAESRRAAEDADAVIEGGTR